MNENAFHVSINGFVITLPLNFRGNYFGLNFGRWKPQPEWSLANYTQLV